MRSRTSFGFCTFATAAKHTVEAGTPIETAHTNVPGRGEMRFAHAHQAAHEFRFSKMMTNAHLARGQAAHTQFFGKLARC